MVIPLQKFASLHNFDVGQIKRFGCIAYCRVQRKLPTKFSFTGHRTILVGYTPTGYLLLKPEQGKIYESRHVRFNEKKVYGDLYKKDEIKDHVVDPIETDKEKFFVEKLSEENESSEILEQEGEKPKRKRGRPRKVREDNKCPEKPILNDSVTELGEINTNLTKCVFSDFHSRCSKENEGNLKYHELYALLVSVNNDPISYKEAIISLNNKELNNKRLSTRR